MRWCPVFSLHLAPDLEASAVAHIVKAAYRPLTRMLLRNAAARGALVVDAGTTERLWREGHEEVVIALRTLIERAQLEPLGTAAYGAPLPLLTDEEATRAIARNAAINRTFFGLAYRPTGAIARACAASPAFARVVARAGYRYAICDTRACAAFAPAGPLNAQRLRTPAGLALLAADAALSEGVAPPATMAAMVERAGEGTLAVIPAEPFAADRARARRISALLRSERLVCETPSERLVALERAAAPVAVGVPDGGPWLLWRDPRQRIHRLQWRLTAHALALVSRDPDGRPRARDLLDRALCADFYAAALPPPLWNRARVLYGAQLLLESVLAAPADEEEQAEARYYALQIGERAGAYERALAESHEPTGADAPSSGAPRAVRTGQPPPERPPLRTQAEPQGTPRGPAEAR